MRTLLFGIAFSVAVIFVSCNTSQLENIAFYEVPLVCGAAPELGCGSRIKPLFLDTERETAISESWTNRGGTVLAFVLNSDEGREHLQPLFEKHGIEATFISDTARHHSLVESFHKDAEEWFKGMDVDKLSIEEAGIIAKSLTGFAEKERIITHDESEEIRKDIEGYFKKELVMVRSYDELKSSATQEKWMQDGYAIYVSHIGKERADSVSALYARGEYESEDWCCEESAVTTSVITCPKCGHTKTETMPTDACLLKYTCEKCKTEMAAKEGDCCVFCSYGTHRCPSKQDKS